MSDFAPGVVVVCVDDAPRPMRLRPVGLRRGAIYRVTAVFETVLGLLVVTLAGMDPSPHRGWAPDRFRKIRPADEGFSVWMKQMRPRVQERTDA